jgi:hypothetical protein
MLSRPTATPDPPIGHVALEENRSYLIDARTESCILEDLHWALHVDCAKLKENVPEAAKFITWELKPVPPVPPTP